jgi:hypothetical protein
VMPVELSKYEKDALDLSAVTMRDVMLGVVPPNDT